MLDVLRDVIENDLPGLLERRDEWRSVHVTYHPPRVERLWIQHGDLRVLLHRIHPCAPDEPLYHPHPWPSAVRIISGHYEHKIGFMSQFGDNLHTLSTGVLAAGSEYEMTNRMSWHSVRPLDYHSDSIMVIGPLYKPSVRMPSPPTEKQGPLSPERFDELFREWHEIGTRRRRR